MDFPTWITIVSIPFTIVSIIVASYQIYLSRKDFIKTSEMRQNALLGKWEGKFNQFDGLEEKELKGEIKAEFTSVDKKVKGFLQYDTDYIGAFDEKIIFDGGFKDSRFLSLSYHNENKAKTQFGFFIFEFSPSGSELSGRFIGFGSQSRKIVNEDIILYKI